MFNLLFGIIESIVNAVKSIIELVLAIPTYVAEMMNYINMLPGFIKAFAAVVLSICVIKGIKRLVI